MFLEDYGCYIYRDLYMGARALIDLKALETMTLGHGDPPFVVFKHGSELLRLSYITTEYSKIDQNEALIKPWKAFPKQHFMTKRYSSDTLVMDVLDEFNIEVDNV